MKTGLTNRVEANRQRQMLRLMERYSKLIQEPNTWILPYSWNVTYIELTDPDAKIREKEFFPHTNNLVFAAMIFEARMLPKKITIVNIEFNSLVRQ